MPRNGKEGRSRRASSSCVAEIPRILPGSKLASTIEGYNKLYQYPPKPLNDAEMRWVFPY